MIRRWTGHSLVWVFCPAAILASLQPYSHAKLASASCIRYPSAVTKFEMRRGYRGCASALQASVCACG
eukprot:3939586-Rhodomonas_salina.2